VFGLLLASLFPSFFATVERRTKKNLLWFVLKRLACTFLSANIVTKAYKFMLTSQQATGLSSKAGNSVCTFQRIRKENKGVKGVEK